MEKLGSSVTLSNAAPITLEDALHALTAINQDCVLLNYGTTIMRRDYQNIDKVRLLGGGVAGVDLSQVIFVGKGMLTGAILGESVVPSSRQVLRTIKEMNQGPNGGIFVIVQANADLFSFALAVERANLDCQTRVKILVIDDDRSEPKERYSCGFILMTKVLGAMAERGMNFDDIYTCYKEIVQHIVTVRLNYQESEGPQRRKTLSLTDFERKVRNVIDSKSQMDLKLHPSIPLVALINTTKHLERVTELGLVKLVIEKLRQLGVCLVRLYYGNFLTVALGHATLTVMKIFDNKIIQYLEDECDASGWCRAVQFLPEVTLKNEIPGLLERKGKQEIPLKGAKLSESESMILMRCVQFACDALISCERQLNTIDTETSDANVGTRLKTMAENINSRLNNKTLPINCPYAFLKKVGIIAEVLIGGTMGSIYGMFFESAANVFEELPELDYIMPIFIWVKALTAGSVAIRALCTREKEETTMVFPIKCCEVAINREMEHNHNCLQCYEIGVVKAEEAAAKTRIFPNKYPDPGAHAVGIWIRALFEAAKLMTALNTSEIE